MKDYLWVVEENANGLGWQPWETRPTRARARRLQRYLKATDLDFNGHTRVVRYVRDETSLRHWDDPKPCQCDDCTRAKGE